MVARAVRGQDIATRLRIERRESENGALWSVPSQSGRGVYTVDFRGKTPTCTCPDHELSSLKCKHVYAVEFAIRAEVARDMGEPVEQTPPPCLPKRPTYRQDWPAYNAAQTHEKAHFQEFLSALCRDIPDLPRQPGPGRARLPLRDMVFASCFKVCSTVSCRRFMSDLAEPRRR
jgi:hypothetical protein